MHDLTCRDARLWLQAPDELVVLDARHLERHLAECRDCDAYRASQVMLDGEIRRSLQAATGEASVREQVGARLRAMPAAGPAQPSASCRRPSRLRSLLPALAGVPVAAVIAVLLLTAPQVLTHRPVTPAISGFHLVQPSIGYPLTIDPTRPDHLLAGDWGEVYESWNAGATWRRLAPLPGDVVVRDVAVDASDPRRYLVATKHSVLLSVDAGKHWTVAVRGLLGAENMFLLQHPQSPTTFYLGPSILWRSTDHGRTWKPTGRDTVFAPDGIQALTFAPNGDLITGIWAGGVAISRDGGRTWQRRAAGLAPDVMGVAVGSHHRLWAATDRGVYVSANNGISWQRRGPSFHFLTTSVLDGGRYILAGGNGAVLRSADGGRHWRVVSDGLPLDPYVYGFIADPRHHNRMYASLDSDGIFRSDDGGRHWHAVNTGLQIKTQTGSDFPVLFRRAGILWATNANGADPGNLTIDARIGLAAVAPDGATAAYVTGVPGGWSARVVSVGGSAARTVAAGAGAIPRSILWSPDSSLIALTAPHGVTVTDPSGQRHLWVLAPTDRVLGWAAGSHALLVWNGRNGRVFSRSPMTGAILSAQPGSYAVPPLPAPNGRGTALLLGGRLFAGSWVAGVHPVASGLSACLLTGWSDDSRRLLLACGGTAQERTLAGALAGRIVGVPAGAFWAPGSDTDLLYFRHGALWRRSPGAPARELVPHAQRIRPDLAADRPSALHLSAVTTGRVYRIATASTPGPRSLYCSSSGQCELTARDTADRPDLDRHFPSPRCRIALG